MLQTQCRAAAAVRESGTLFATPFEAKENDMTRATFAEKQERPVRAGVFPTLPGAEQAVRGLLAAGFSKEQITVICSDETKEKYFREFEHQESAGSNTPAAAA